MSRKRKGNRRRQGGRVTPPKATSIETSGFDADPDFPVRSSEGWTPVGGAELMPPDGQTDVHEVFSAMASEMGSLRDSHPAAVEELASQFVSILAIAASEQEDEPADGPPSPADRVRAIEMLGVAASLLAEAERTHPNAAYIDCLRALDPFLDQETRDGARMVVERADGRSTAPAWASAIWQAAPVGAWRAGDLLGDSLNLGIELTWPGEWENQVLFGSLILTEGPFVNDLVVATLDEFTEVYTPDTGYPVGPEDRPYLADVIRYLEPADVVETARDLGRGIDISHTDTNAPLQPGFDSLAPLAGLLLERLSAAAPPEEPTQTSVEERTRVITAFLASYEATALTAGETAEFVQLFFDYVETRSDGDVLRWSPAIVAAFIDWFHHTRIASDADDQQLLTVLEAWVRYSHRLKTWPTSVTDEALLQMQAQLTEGVDAAALWEESLSDGLERMAEELGVDLADSDQMAPLLDVWNKAEDSVDDQG